MACTGVLIGLRFDALLLADFHQRARHPPGGWWKATWPFPVLAIFVVLFFKHPVWPPRRYAGGLFAPMPDSWAVPLA